ncbi:YjbQ family protein [Arsenicitalea aurantiaca]|uniref:YjbQ family protein n=1 Tax=Arsenicitalea aurantiaca TaxID=1783274 RepID=A0A433XLS3_9HYPH|nr:secondary thiamine-phosphate synthase enzyme YjbQ [Arsenicitalea aurantiaca]RUT35029.1 YjbQ family protein [Arsenicitalea aurantiaca]
MKQALKTLSVPTRGKGLYELTKDVLAFLVGADPRQGLLTLYCRHTSCSLLVQENADPDVRRDLDAYFDRLVPEGMDFIIHTLEGPDDMPAHIRAALTQTSLSIPVTDGRAVLGTWQGIYLFEHRTRPHRREIVLHYIGD